MNIQEYQDWIKTNNIVHDIRTDHYKMFYAVGMAGECGEICNKFKKLIRDDLGRNEDGSIKPEFRLDLMQEYGDLLWYLVESANTLKISLQEIIDENVRKLEARNAAN